MSQTQNHANNPEEYISPKLEIIPIQVNTSLLIGSPDNEQTTEELLF